MRLAVFPKYAALNSGPVLQALVEGFQHHGVTIDTESLDSDAVIIWSQLWAGRMKHNQLIYQHYKNHNRPVIVVDVGCIHRDKTWRISLDGQHHIAGLGHDDSRKKILNLTSKPWQHVRGDHILIALQRTDSNQWSGMPNLEIWLESIVSMLQQHSDRPLFIRPHPRFPVKISLPGTQIELPCRLPNTYDSFNFLGSPNRPWSVVNWNSTPGVISALDGIPVFTGPTSLASSVANLDFSRIENPNLPDREQWINDLAWTEWLLEELKQGDPQRHILDAMRRQ